MDNNSLNNNQLYNYLNTTIQPQFNNSNLNNIGLKGIDNLNQTLNIKECVVNIQGSNIPVRFSIADPMHKCCDNNSNDI